MALQKPYILNQIDTIKSDLAESQNQLGDITQLNTTDKSSVVNALKEVKTQTNTKANQVDLTNLQTQVNSIGNGSPKGTYATLSALQTAYPTGTTGIYIVAADGKWYYWNGSTWTPGGTYQSTGIALDSVLMKNLYNVSSPIFSVANPQGVNTTYSLPIPAGSKLKLSLTGVNATDIVNAIAMNESGVSVGVALQAVRADSSIEYTPSVNLSGFRVTDNANSIVTLTVEKTITENSLKAQLDNLTTDTNTQMNSIKSDITKNSFNTGTPTFSVANPQGVNTTYSLPLLKDTKITISLTGVNASDIVSVQGINTLGASIGLILQAVRADKSIDYICTQDLSGLRVTDNANSIVTLKVVKTFTENSIKTQVDSLNTYVYKYDFRPNAVEANRQVLSSLMSNYANGLKMKSELSANFIKNLLKTGDKTTHDSTLIIKNGIAYVVYTANTVSEGDNASSSSAFIRLDKFDLSNPTNVTTYVVSENGSSFNGITISGGSGSPTMVEDRSNSNIIHIIFSAYVSDGYYAQISCQFDISTNTLSNYNKVIATKDSYSAVFNNTWINTVYSLSLSLASYQYTQTNCTVGYYNGNYYIALVFGNGNGVNNGKVIIFSTSDFINWTFVADSSSLNISPLCECACYCDNEGYLYVAIRPMYPTYNTGSGINPINGGYGVLAKLKISTKAWVDQVRILNSSSRPCFFEYNSKLYLTSNPYSRDYTNIIEVNKYYLDASKTIQQCNFYAPYISVYIYNNIVYCSYSANGIITSSFSIGSISDTDIETKFKTLFSIT